MPHLGLLALAIATVVGLIGVGVQVAVGGSRIKPLTDQAGDPHGPRVSVIVAARDVASVQGRVDRILLLRDGRLSPLTRLAVRRVAERAIQ